MKSYHNTVPEVAGTLGMYEAKARTQDERVLDMFQKSPSIGRTPSEVHMKLNINAPLTSTRRAMSNLTKQLKLRKSSEKRQGTYGRMESVWYCCPSEPTQGQLL
jgi:hypothetical protein